MTPETSAASPEPTITAKNVDLSNCDRELVQFPGAIQPHGVLLVLSEPDWSLLQLSANAGSLFDAAPRSLIGRKLSRLIGAEQMERLRLRAQDRLLTGAPVHLMRVGLHETQSASLREFEVFAHRHDGVLILELEDVDGRMATVLPDLYAEVRHCITRLQGAQSLPEFLDLAAEQVRRLTGFERVHVYQFREDRSGLVRAESKSENLPSYLGLRFPATDVPEPARRLLSRLWLRHLPDAAYQPVPLVPETNPLSAKPLDLSHALLRSTSPLCNRFYLNMGVRATLILALLKDGQLWGFIGCHHGTARHVPHEVRAACESLAHMVSLLMAAKEDAEHAAEALAAKARVERLIEAMSREELFLIGLVRSDPDLPAALDASGAAILVGEGITLLGDTPTEAQTEALARWLDGQDEIFATDRLAARYGAASEFQAVASGLLAIRLPEAAGYVLWFRPEQIEEARWAGDPVKPVEIDAQSGEARLGPRRSFEIWRETIEGRSRPWRDYHLEAAASLRRAIDALYRAERLAQANQSLEQSNRALARSNVDLESFAYMAAHDLKEPLRGIGRYSALLKEDLGESLPDGGRDRLDTILRLTRRMGDLIDVLLNYSRLGRAPLAPVPADMNEVVGEALDSLRPWLEAARAEVAVEPRLPIVTCDPARIMEVFMNLIANGIKYNDRDHKRVEIGVRTEGEPVFYVRDNGIGIEARHHGVIFEIFRRLHGRDTYGGGTGAGLAIVKKVIERHGGSIWVESTPGEGSTFFFTLQDHSGPAVPADKPAPPVASP